MSVDHSHDDRYLTIHEHTQETRACQAALYGAIEQANKNARDAASRSAPRWFSLFIVGVVATAMGYIGALAQGTRSIVDASTVRIAALKEAADRTDAKLESISRDMGEINKAVAIIGAKLTK